MLKYGSLVEPIGSVALPWSSSVVHCTGHCNEETFGRTNCELWSTSCHQSCKFLSSMLGLYSSLISRTLSAFSQSLRSLRMRLVLHIMLLNIMCCIPFQVDQKGSEKKLGEVFRSTITSLGSCLVKYEEI